MVAEARMAASVPPNLIQKLRGMTGLLGTKEVCELLGIGKIGPTAVRRRESSRIFDWVTDRSLTLRPCSGLKERQID